MFQIGDKVVYPMHGAGIIEAIEEREVLGEKKKYYIMRLPLGDMKVMIPVGNVEEVGLRTVIAADEVKNVIDALRSGTDSASPNWNRRYRSNLQKMRSGNIYEVAEVVRTLARREHEKGLSTGERRMLESARRILLSELTLARGIGADEASHLLDQALA